MLEGKNVLVSEPDRLKFFYPDYQLVEKLNEWTLDKRIIYNGKYYAGLENDLRMYTKSYISLVGQADVVLHTKKDWLDFAYSKHNKKTPKYVLESYEALDDTDYWFSVKGVWLTGKWLVPTIPSEKIFSLFQASGKSFLEILRQYYALLEEYPLPYIESSFLTFLAKVKQAPELTTDNVSAKYLQVLRNTHARTKNKIPSAIDSYLRQSPKSDSRFLQLLFNLFQ